MKLLSWISMSSSAGPSKDLVDNSTQTIIKVHPYVFDNVDDFAYVTSDKKLQSVVSVKPSEETNKFLNLLRYTPYQDITEGNSRVIDLGRKKKLQFAALVQFQAESDYASKFSMADDDGVGYVCCEIIRKRLNGKGITVYQDKEAQTDLKVRPHVLEDVDVALVSEDKETQTANLEPPPPPPTKYKGCVKRTPLN